MKENDEGLERLPCGCVCGTIGDAFVYMPCSLLCEFYLYAVAESKRQGKPLITKVL